MNATLQAFFGIGFLLIAWAAGVWLILRHEMAIQRVPEAKKEVYHHKV